MIWFLWCFPYQSVEGDDQEEPEDRPVLEEPGPAPAVLRKKKQKKVFFSPCNIVFLRLLPVPLAASRTTSAGGTPCRRRRRRRCRTSAALAAPPFRGGDTPADAAGRGERPRPRRRCDGAAAAAEGESRRSAPPRTCSKVFCPINFLKKSL